MDDSVLATRSIIGEREHAFTERILEELYYWYRVSAQQQEHILALRSPSYHQTSELLPAVEWCDDKGMSISADRMDNAPILQGLGDTQTKMELDQIRIAAMWAFLASEV